MPASPSSPPLPLTRCTIHPPPTFQKSLRYLFSRSRHAIVVYQNQHTISTISFCHGCSQFCRLFGNVAYTFFWRWLCQLICNCFMYNRASLVRPLCLICMYFVAVICGGTSNDAIILSTHFFMVRKNTDKGELSFVVNNYYH